MANQECGFNSCVRLGARKGQRNLLFCGAESVDSASGVVKEAPEGPGGSQLGFASAQKPGFGIPRSNMTRLCIEYRSLALES